MALPAADLLTSQLCFSFLPWQLFLSSSPTKALSINVTSLGRHSDYSLSDNIPAADPTTMEVDNKNTTRKRKSVSTEIERSAKKDKQPFEVSAILVLARSMCITLDSCSAPWKIPLSIEEKLHAFRGPATLRERGFSN